MADFPWSDDVWRPSEKSLRAAQRGRAYAVRLKVTPDSVLERAWHRLSTALTNDEAVLLDGGAALVRLGANQVEVISGGEDVLDSLSWSINQTVREAVTAADPAATLAVVDEGKPTGRSGTG